MLRYRKKEQGLGGNTMVFRLLTKTGRQMNRNLQTVETAGESDATSKVAKALDHPQWDFRTIEGIAKETGLSNFTIEKTLEDPSRFRKSPVTDRLGRSLFTLASHPIRWREYLAVLQYALKHEMSLF